MRQSIGFPLVCVCLPSRAIGDDAAGKVSSARLPHSNFSRVHFTHTLILNRSNLLCCHVIATHVRCSFHVFPFRPCRGASVASRTAIPGNTRHDSRNLGLLQECKHLITCDQSNSASCENFQPSGCRSDRWDKSTCRSDESKTFEYSWSQRQASEYWWDQSEISER